jgi:hypothetical protein
MSEKSYEEQGRRMAKFFELSNRLTGRAASPAEEAWLREQAMRKLRNPAEVQTASIEQLRRLALSQE